MHKDKPDWQSWNWNPSTCDCKVELTREDTEFVLDKDGNIVFDEVPVTAFNSRDERRKRRGKHVFNADRTRLVTIVPRLRTQKRNIAGEIISEVIHGPTEDAPMTGTRPRGYVVEPCPDHVGFSDVINPTHWKPKLVTKDHLECDCKFQLLYTGDKGDKEMLGASPQEICDRHKHLPVRDLYDVVSEENRAHVKALAEEEALAENSTEA